jgi:hypothetical protein
MKKASRGLQLLQQRNFGRLGGEYAHWPCTSMRGKYRQSEAAALSPPAKLQAVPTN